MIKRGMFCISTKCCSCIALIAAIVFISISPSFGFFAAAVNPVRANADDAAPSGRMQSKPANSSPAKSTSQPASVIFTVVQHILTAPNQHNSSAATHIDSNPKYSQPINQQLSNQSAAKQSAIDTEPAPARRPSRAFSVEKSPEADQLHRMCAAMEPLPDIGPAAESAPRPSRIIASSEPPLSEPTRITHPASDSTMHGVAFVPPVGATGPLGAPLVLPHAQGAAAACLPAVAIATVCAQACLPLLSAVSEISYDSSREVERGRSGLVTL
jgi:hypothetical protein